MANPPKHFKGKDALHHVIEAQAQGIASNAEIHGAEIPGHVSALADAARETALVILLLWIVVTPISFPFIQNMLLISLFATGWLIWKVGRSTWLAWSRLERLHRIVAEEQWEIEHHRQQERDELRELYRAKGFEGKLLEDVLDVLMADGDRILRVMVQEELGLSLGSYEHPLKQGFGAGIGTLIAAIVCIIGGYLSVHHGIPTASLIVIGLAAALSAYYQNNKITPAIIWNISLAILAGGTVHYLLKFSFEQSKI